MRVCLRFVSALFATTAVVFQASAATLYWDGGIGNITTHGDGISAGGTGVWNATLCNWDQGADLAHIVWRNATLDSAVLGGTPGFITLDAPITAHSITLNVSGYTLDQGINTLSAAALAGTGSLTKAGSGTLTLSGASSYSGELTIRDGMVTLNNNASLASGAGVIIEGGAGTVGGTVYPFKGLTRGGTLYLRDDSGDAGGNQLGSQTLTLNNGTVLWYSGDGADITTLDTVSLAGGFNSLSVAPCSSPDMLKISNLFRAPGATAEFRASYHQLGTGEAQIHITKFNGAPIVNTNGILGGWAFVAANLESVEYGGQALDFACWDPNATIDGSVGSIVAATPDQITSGGPNLETGLPFENWLVNNNQTIVADLTINSLIEQKDVHINNGATLTLASGGMILRNNNFWTQGNGYLTSGNNDLYAQADGGLAPKFDQAIKVIIKDGAAGAVTLRKSGSGLLKLGKINTYSGGTVVNQGILDLQVGGASGCIRGAATINPGGTLRLSGGDATGYAGGANALTQIDLNGGTLKVNTTANQTLGSAVINMTGGGITGIAGSNIDFFGGGSALNTLASPTTATISGVTLSALRQGSTTFTVADGPAEIDLDISSAITPANAADSTLFKDGLGTLRLSASNTFERPLTINAGTLLLGGSGSLGANVPVTVANDATLGGSGTLYGTVTATAGSTLAPGGSGAIGTLKLANTGADALTLANARIACDLSTTAGVCDLIALEGAVVLNGENTMAVALPDIVPAGTYTLMTYAAINGNGALTFLPANLHNVTYDVGETAVTLTIGEGGLAVGSLVWRGDGTNNLWNTTSANWFSSSIATTYTDGEAVFFNDAGFNAPNVDITAPVAPTFVKVSNFNKNYTMGGSPIIGGANLTKAGTGSLILTTTNTFSGPVTVDGGTLEAAAATATGNASAIGNGRSPVFVKEDARLLFTGNRSAGYHTGNVIINGGTITGNGLDLNLAAAAALIFDNTPGLINGTGQLNRRGSSNMITVMPPASGSVISIAELKLSDNARFNIDDGIAGADLTVSSIITGDKVLYKNKAGTLTLIGTNTYSGGNELLAGTISVEAMGAFGTGYIALKHGTTIEHTGTGGDTRSGQYWFDAGNAVLSVTNPDAVLTLWRTSGSHNQLLIKKGDGTLRYGATSDNSGYGSLTLARAQVYAGVLEAISSVNNNFANVTVFSGGTFRLGTTDGNGDSLSANHQIEDNTGFVTIEGAGVFDLNGMNETIATLNIMGGTVSAPGTLTVSSAVNAQNGSIAANLAGAGNLVKSTTGAATLSGANSYSGTTAVNAGTLLVNGAHTGVGAYTVAANATLGGTGSVAAGVNLAANATLSPGAAAGAGGKLTLGALTLEADAVIWIDAVEDSVDVNGDLTFNDNLITLSNIDLLADNKRRIFFSYTGELTGMPRLAADYGTWNLRHNAGMKTIYLINNIGSLLIVR